MPWRGLCRLVTRASRPHPALLGPRGVGPGRAVFRHFNGLASTGGRGCAVQRHRRGHHTFVGSAEPIMFKKCRFMGSLFVIDGPDDVAPALAALLADNTHRVRKATHPAMHAWVCAGDRSGSDDCGEATSGRKILAILEKWPPAAGAAGVDSGGGGGGSGSGGGGFLVAVTRWYGGSHLGSARWRVIAQATRSALDLYAPQLGEGAVASDGHGKGGRGGRRGRRKRRR